MREGGDKLKEKKVELLKHQVKCPRLYITSLDDFSVLNKGKTLKEIEAYIKDKLKTYEHEQDELPQSIVVNKLERSRSEASPRFVNKILEEKRVESSNKFSAIVEKNYALRGVKVDKAESPRGFVER